MTAVQDSRSQAEHWSLERLLQELGSVVHGKTVNFREDAAVHQLRRRLALLIEGGVR